MNVGDYPVRGKPYWGTFMGVAVLGMLGLVLMFAVH
jgi:hypothetical protein